MDFGSTAVTGIHVVIVEKLREYYGLEKRPVKVIEPYQMLGEIDPDCREDFIEYMDEMVAEYDKDQDIHVILDNYSTHKKNESWLASNPNVHFHFTPTSASWCNQVEIWFGIFSRKSLDGSSHVSTEALSEHILSYVNNYNKTCKPFTWRKREVRGTQLKNNIVNLRN